MENESVIDFVKHLSKYSESIFWSEIDLYLLNPLIPFTIKFELLLLKSFVVPISRTFSIFKLTILFFIISIISNLFLINYPI